jgi:hypothetical protein
MNDTMKQNQVQESADQIADRLMANGLKCYCVARGFYFLWVPWKQKTVLISDTRAVKRHLGISDGRLATKVSMECMRRREVLLLPDSIAWQYPMPLPASGERFPSNKDMLKWTKSVLQQINKQKGIKNAN